MACEFITGDGIVFNVWGKPAKSDFDQLLNHLRSSSEKVSGPVVYVSRVPVDAPAPDAQVRGYLNSLMPAMTPLFSSCHIVLEGVGFAAAMKRGVLVSLFQIGRQRNMFFVHANVSEVVWKVPVEQQAAVNRTIRRAEASGLLSCRPPASQVA
jgi:hypothetical protein